MAGLPSRLSCERWMYTAMFVTSAACSAAVIGVVVQGVRDRSYTSSTMCAHTQTYGLNGRDVQHLLDQHPADNHQHQTTGGSASGAGGVGGEEDNENLCWTTLLRGMGTTWYWYDEAWVVASCCAVMMWMVAVGVVQCEALEEHPQPAHTAADDAAAAASKTSLVRNKSMVCILALLTVCVALQTGASIYVATSVTGTDTPQLLDTQDTHNIRSSLLGTINRYSSPNNDEMMRYWFHIQDNWCCCGVDGYTDWYRLDPEDKHIPDECYYLESKAEDFRSCVSAGSRYKHKACCERTKRQATSTAKSQSRKIISVGCLDLVTNSINYAFYDVIKSTWNVVMALSMPAYIALSVTLAGVCFDGVYQPAARARPASVSSVTSDIEVQMEHTRKHTDSESSYVYTSLASMLASSHVVDTDLGIPYQSDESLIKA